MFSAFLEDPTGQLIHLLLTLPGVLVAIAAHESAHGLMAYKLGDDTAKRAGRISLDPFKHVDLYGFLMLLLFRVGWAKPVNVNVRRFKKPKRDMCLTALAGPVTNLLLSVIFLFVAELVYMVYAANYMRFGQTAFSTVLEVISDIFSYASVINIGLGVFNFLPVPPLDGWKVLGAFLPTRAYFAVMRYERYGMLLLVGLLFFGVLSAPMAWLVDWIFQWELNMFLELFSLIM